MDPTSLCPINCRTGIEQAQGQVAGGRITDIAAIGLSHRPSGHGQGAARRFHVDRAAGGHKIPGIHLGDRA